MTAVAEATATFESPATTQVSRYLLLTGTAPGEPGVGGVILKDIIEQSGRDRWNCCWLAPRQGPQLPFWSAIRTKVINRRFETGYRPLPGIAGEMISAAALKVRRWGMISNAQWTALECCRDWQPEVLVAVLESPAVIETVRQLQQVCRIPVRSIVWDDVDVLCRQAYFDRWTCRRMERTFGDVLRGSERVAVICETMQREYHRRYGVESTIIRHGVVPIADSEDGQESSSRDEYHIGFAGSNTAPDCLRSLVEGLDAVGWQIDGRDVILRILGARYLLDSRKAQRIEYFGWRPVEETRTRLSECDLLYLPQTFADDNRTFAELSFPTKLSTYLAARRPILLHAPDYASLTEFWRQFPLGPAVDSLNASDVMKGVQTILQANRLQRDEWRACGASVVEQAIGPKPFAAAVREFLC
ncbi:MAG TPA: hypothetical protein VFG20_01120 [Planctomycetaceae bacterium]|nr:hypothetical protein [Planctomycetaceae bacterium]